MSRTHHQMELRSNKRTKSHHISEGTFLSKIFGLHHCSANEYTNTYCLSPSVLVKKKMKVPKGSKYQDRTLEKRKEVREMLKICRVKVSYQRSPYPEKIMIKKMNCKISRSQPTTKRAKKFIIQNIKIATTPVVPIPFGLQDVVKIATPDSCSPDYKISRTHHQTEQRSN